MRPSTNLRRYFQSDSDIDCEIVMKDVLRFSQIHYRALLVRPRRLYFTDIVMFTRRLLFASKVCVLNVKREIQIDAVRPVHNLQP